VDALLFLGLFLLLFEGILVYDLVLRNPILKLAAAIPVHEEVVRRAYRQQWFLLSSALVSAIILTLATTREMTPSSLAPLFHIALPIFVGIPVFAAPLCYLLANVGRPRSETRLGKALGREMLPSDLSPMIYGSAVTFGGLGAWLLLLHFACRLWSEAGTPWPLIVLSSAGLLVAGFAALWSDRHGPPAIIAACARLVFLDSQGLLLASRHQKSSPAIMKGTQGLSTATLVRVQALRRAPLFPVFIAFLALLALVRGAAFGWTSVAAAVALGLSLDSPARWIQQRLVSLDFLLILGAARGNRVGDDFLRRELQGFSVVFQATFVTVLVVLGLIWGNPLVNMLAMGAIAWTVAAATGSFLALRIGSGWPTIRMLLMIGAISFAWFPSEGIL